MKNEKKYTILALAVIFGTFFIAISIMIGFWSAVLMILTTIAIFIALMSTITAVVNYRNKKNGLPPSRIIIPNGAITLVCDNHECDYTYEIKAKYIKYYVDALCPKCGNVILTEKDYSNWKLLRNLLKILNVVFGWTVRFYSKSDIKMAKVQSVDGKMTVETNCNGSN